jgi:hypothetical protein
MTAIRREPLTTHLFRNEEKERWIEDYVERETAGARMRVEDTEAAVQQEQDDMTHAEIIGLTSRELQTTIEEMLVAIRNSLSDLASSDDGEDGEDEDDEETEQGNMSEDDEPGCCYGGILSPCFNTTFIRLNTAAYPFLENPRLPRLYLLFLKE